jgi:single-stranded DNA-binding protein
VDVVLWAEQAEYARTRLKRGDTVMVLGSLLYESWEKDGKKQSKIRVKGRQVQYIDAPVRESGAAEGRDMPRSNAREAPRRACA